MSRSLLLVPLGISCLFLTACGGKKGADGRVALQQAPMGKRAALLVGVNQHHLPPHEEKGNTEEYARIVENPFQLAKTTPLSTFSIDVDTASYSNVRRYLNIGRRPPKDAVRIEEMINYFSYAYPEPKGKHPVSITTDLVNCPWAPKHHLARIALRAKSMDPEEMPPRNLVFLLDTSGSMSSANKLPLLKRALSLLVTQLDAQDRVAIVTYAGSAGVALPSTPGDQRQRILKAFDDLNASGSTNGSQGIHLAYDIALKNFLEGGLNRVILGTDGDFNIGVSDTGALTRLIEQKRKAGVYLSVLGLGMGNIKDSRLESLAHHGNGHYAYLDNDMEAHKLFVEQGGALFTVANDVKLQIEFNPTKVQAYRLIGYENRLMKAQDFNDDKKDAGDMGSGHTVTALYEIVPHGVKIDIPGVDPLKYQKPSKPVDSKEWLTVKLRYKEPGQMQSQLLSRVLSGEPLRFDDASNDFRFAVSVAAFGQILRDSKYKGQITLEEVRKIATSSADVDKHRLGFLDLIRKAELLK